MLLTLPGGEAAADGGRIRQWTVDGVQREAIVYVPESARLRPSPLVFGFHGHGGSMANAAGTFRIHEVWPEAIVVYMQGLKTPGQLTDPEGRRSGWQKMPGDQNDRDLNFFDAVLQSLRKELKVDEGRIYSTGHSNGGGFTYLLWAKRGDVFAAMAPSGAAALRLRDRLSPKPVLHIAGTNDPLVRYTWQQQMIETLKTRQRCLPGTPWHEKATLYPSTIDAPVVTYLTKQGHKYPADAPELIVWFFQEYSKTKPGSQALSEPSPGTADGQTAPPR
jgi:polyhydroxybutyrate depolymerase